MLICIVHDIEAGGSLCVAKEHLYNASELELFWWLNCCSDRDPNFYSALTNQTLET